MSKDLSPLPVRLGPIFLFVLFEMFFPTTVFHIGTVIQGRTWDGLQEHTFLSWPKVLLQLPPFLLKLDSARNVIHSVPYLPCMTKALILLMNRSRFRIFIPNIRAEKNIYFSFNLVRIFQRYNILFPSSPCVSVVT